ncbi:glycosyl hydrolase family 18 protein [Granulicella sp. dw_53]|uniref:glycoside hydrolase family 18 protein n=1 Tax=Granulicella sp. dw_53 TaxID=2719792 RepID=UPI001BD1E5B6|nr:glycosyl hydrolase family 18 protein [Granulicella sp. dw_53]
MTGVPNLRSLLRTTVIPLALLLCTPLWSASPPSNTRDASSAIQRPLLTGYFPQWGLYNQPQYTVKNLLTIGGASVLDQMNYAQAFVTGGRCSIADPNADLNYTFPAEQSVDGVADKPDQIFRGNLNQLVKLKRKLPNLKLIISLEGRAASFAEDAQPQNRAAFVESCIDLFLKGNLAPGIQAAGLFDGIDIDWEYPHREDAENYLALLSEFRKKMDALRPGLLLNVAVGPSPRMYPGTDMAAVSKLVDQVGLMTYDFNGPWSATTGFIAPLRAREGQEGGTVEHTVQSYITAGVPASKLLVGLPFYGYGWHKVTEDNNGLFQEGQSIHGDRPYRSIVDIIEQSTVYRDELSQAPWIFDGDVFWTYEDPTSIRQKSEYIHQQHLGGFMIWELGEDTSTGLLLHAAHTSLTHPSVDTAQQTSSPTPTATK